MLEDICSPCACVWTCVSLSSLEVAAAEEEPAPIPCSPHTTTNLPPPHPPLWTPIRQSNTLWGRWNMRVGLFVFLSINCDDGPPICPPPIDPCPHIDPRHPRMKCLSSKGTTAQLRLFIGFQSGGEGRSGGRDVGWLSHSRNWLHAVKWWIVTSKYHVAGCFCIAAAGLFKLFHYHRDMPSNSEKLL